LVCIAAVNKVFFNMKLISSLLHSNNSQKQHKMQINFMLFHTFAKDY